MPLYDLTFDTDPDVYTIDLPTPLAELDDDYALHLMRTTMLTLADAVKQDALDIAEHNFGDDDTDYMPARANALTALIFTLTSLDGLAFTPADQFRQLLKNHDFCLDMLTLGADTATALSIDYKD